MRGFALGLAFASMVGLMLAAGPGSASLYTPETRFAIPFDGGKPLQLPFDEFRRRLAVLMNALNERKVNGKDNPDRQAFLDRVKPWVAMPGDTAAEISRKEQARKKLPLRNQVVLAVELLRVGRQQDALNILQPHVSDRRQDYLVFSTVAHIHAFRGEWNDAYRYHMEGRIETELPKDLKGLSKEQCSWWEMLDAAYLPHYYRIHADDAAARLNISAPQREKLDEEEDVLPLFPLPDENKKQSPVKFVNDAGVYEPGVLAAAERAKLPPDAVAIVQQLLLWFPTDVRLYWLLAELYAADGDLDTAATIFDECVGGLAHGNRKILMEHRYAVRAAIDARNAQNKPAGSPISMRTILLYFGAVGVVAIVAFGRVLYRRIRAARA